MYSWLQASYFLFQIVKTLEGLMGDVLSHMTLLRLTYTLNNFKDIDDNSCNPHMSYSNHSPLAESMPIGMHLRDFHIY